MKACAKRDFELDDVDMSLGGDEFYNKRKLLSLAKLLNKVEESKVICVDGEWGTGKSFFCKVFEKYTSGGFKVIYFDAYKADFNCDPLVAILSEILLVSDKSKSEARKRDLAFLAKPFLGRGVKAFANMVPVPGASYVGNELSSVVESMIENYASMDKSVSELRALLNDIVKEQEQKKVVFVIDELDRCRPNYALEIIEKIKHVFEVDGISFILSMNKEQLLSSIEHAYGISGRRESYLEKFIDFTVRLNPINREAVGSERYNAEVEYCKTLMQKRLSFVDDDDFVSQVSGYGALITYKQELSFRGVDRFVDNCVTCYLVSDGGEISSYKAVHACFLCCCVFSVTNSPETTMVSNDSSSATGEFCKVVGINNYVKIKNSKQNAHVLEYRKNIIGEEDELGGKELLGILGTVGLKGASNHPGNELSLYVEELQINIGRDDAREIFKFWADVARMIG